MSKKKQIFKNIVNLIILFLSMELINILVKGIPEFSNIDLRLIFIFIVANSMGIKYGIVFAILSSISYIIQNYNGASYIDVIFLNTNNWLQIVVYLIFAIIIGLKHDKDSLKLKSLQDSIDDSKEKEETNKKMIELYKNELKEFNQVLLTHEKTYTQVSEFIQKLSNVKYDNEKISQLLKVMLNNDTCELTTMQSIHEHLDKEKLDIMNKNHIWINKNLKKELPCYIAPILLEDQDLAIIIWKCDFEQMNIDYRNQIIGISKIIKYVLSH